MTTVEGIRSTVRGQIVPGLEIRGVGHSKWIPLPSLFTNENIPDTRSEIATRNIVRKHDHISHLAQHFPKRVDRRCTVLLLVGSNCGPAMETTQSGTHAPFVHESPLGWSVVGPVCGPSSSNEFVTLRTSVQVEPVDVEIQFDNVDYNTKCIKDKVDDEMSGLSRSDVKFNEIMHSSIITNKIGNLQMDLPIKENSHFPDNKDAVFKRTLNTLNRLKRDPDKLDQCLAVMGKYLTAGHVQELPVSDITVERGKAWYVPIFSVTHPKKKTYRLVFDSSAEFEGVSLNSNLHQGPDNNNSLLGVLLRFRLGEVGFSCDIENMFHCFYVNPDHCSYLRFFWYSDNNPSNKLSMFQALVHIFGNSCSPAVANYGLRYAASHSPHRSPPSSREFLQTSMYVDDGLSSANSVREAVNTLHGARGLLNHYNIRLHKIVSNSQELIKSFPPSEVSDSAKLICSTDCGVSSTLGILWETTKDMLSLRCEFREKPFTKRGILSTNGANYDPLGLSSPVTLGGKVFQRMVLPPKSTEDNNWSTFGWDDPLPEEYRQTWLTWTAGLSDLWKVRIPRGYTPLGFGDPVKRSVHMFCDASKDSICFVSYMQSFGAGGQVSVSFLYANSKVAPRMANTIPRLELNAAVEATLAARKLSVELKIPLEEVQFYTDSNVLLGYIYNQVRRFKRYVTRRIEIILETSQRNQWQYVSTAINPADIGTKPHTPTELMNTSWFSGPQFLTNWEVQQEYSPEDEYLPEEISTNKVLVSKVLPDVDPPRSLSFTIGRKTSCWNKAIGIMKIILRSLNVLDQSRKKLSINTVERNPMVSRRLAIDKLLIDSQSDSFADSIRAMRQNGEISTKDPLAKYDPFLDNKGVLRVGGRIRRSDIPYHLKHPIILPKNHPVTTMILHNVHHKSMHSGRQITHGILREEGYFVGGGLGSIRSLIANCVLCKILRAPLQQQFMSDLPRERLEEIPPFTNVGIDVFGPYTFHDGKNTRSTVGSKKMWGLIITCLCSRAIHIESLFQMDTSSFRNALCRFWAIRGTCKKIMSDRGTNFLGARNQFEDAVDISSLQKLANSHQIDWEFTTPGASSQGGVWERKVGAIKSAMASSLRQLNQRLPSRDELTTLFQEASQIVNNTPLWDCSPNPTNDYPLSPAMLLTLKESPNPPALESFSQLDLLQYGQKRWRRVQFLADQFWNRWRKGYLHTLQQRQKWKVKKRNCMVGDVVLLKGPTKRNKWPVCKVTELIPSKDGLVRNVVLMVPGPRPRYLRRAVFDTVLLIPSQEEERKD